jgi:rare lipoprotein A (peptidoglycan hydrolase)
MPMLVATLILCLLCGWPLGSATSQPRGQREPRTTQEPGLTPDEIKQAQESLKTEGLHPWSIDGRLGPRTRQAVRAYQAREGLPQTGVLDASTFSRLAPRAPCTQDGLASWYGHAWDGRKTASGDRLSADALTASHRTIPLGTKVRVTHLQTQQQVEVTINDRGPKPKENLIDLSQAAAERLGLKKRGESQVRVEVLAPECPR